MKGVSEKLREIKGGGNCKMSFIRKFHEDFIRELKAPLKSKRNQDEQDILSDDRCRISTSDIDLQKELERKFDELFGTVNDDN